MANGSGVRVNLVIITTWERLVSEEVDRLVFNAGDLLLGFHMLQAVRLVPTGREDVERDLSTDGIAMGGASAEILNSRQEREFRVCQLT